MVQWKKIWSNFRYRECLCLIRYKQIKKGQAFGQIKKNSDPESKGIEKKNYKRMEAQGD